MNIVSNAKIIQNSSKQFRVGTWNRYKSALCVWATRWPRHWYSYWPKLFTVLDKFAGVLPLVRLVYSQLLHG